MGNKRGESMKDIKLQGSKMFRTFKTQKELSDYIETLVPMHSEVCCIVTFQKLWFVSGNFGLTVVIDEAHVKPALEYNKQSSIVYDSDDDEDVDDDDEKLIHVLQFLQFHMQF